MRSLCLDFLLILGMGLIIEVLTDISALQSSMLHDACINTGSYMNAHVL